MEKITGVIEISPEVMKLPGVVIFQVLDVELAQLREDLVKKIKEAKKQ